MWLIQRINISEFRSNTVNQLDKIFPTFVEIAIDLQLFNNAYVSTSTLVLRDPMIHPHPDGGPGNQRREHVVLGLRYPAPHSVLSL